MKFKEFIIFKINKLFIFKKFNLVVEIDFFFVLKERKKKFIFDSL